LILQRFAICIITFSSQFLESKGLYIDSHLFKDNAQYMRNALVAASAIFGDLGDKRKPEYLEAIILDALERGSKMKRRVMDVIQEAGYQTTEKRIRAVVFWNRSAQREHNSNEVQAYLENKNLI